MNPRFLYHPLTLLAIAFLILVSSHTKWLMPGPVSRFHAEFEARCTRCHAPFAGTPDAKCLDCKAKMKLVQNRGIHRYGKVKHCARCHVEHRTREYPLASAWVDPVTFDHRWTGFELGRYHNRLACAKCHPDPGTYRQARLTCAGCHQDFVPGIWDHRKTGCDLDALHAALACRQCHLSKWGAGLPPSCKRCHQRTNYDPKILCRKVSSSKNREQPE